MNDYEHESTSEGNLLGIGLRDAARNNWYDGLNRRDVGPDEIWAAAWEAALNTAIMNMPGGSIIDPQWVCDELRRIGGTHGSAG